VAGQGVSAGVASGVSERFLAAVGLAGSGWWRRRAGDEALEGVAEVAGRIRRDGNEVTDKLTDIRSHFARTPTHAYEAPPQVRRGLEWAEG
jgi:hypothetical protein